MSYEYIPVVLFCALLGFAALSDFRHRIIPNWICGLTAILGLVVHTSNQGLSGILIFAAGLALPLLAFVPLYALRVMGAGDVKLLAAVGAFVGFGEVFNFITITMLFGGVLGLGQVIINKIFWFAPYLARFYYPDETTRNYVPYGVAIAAGGICSQFYTLIEASF
jgi:Flp pilus assembly protein protease CpaA